GADLIDLAACEIAVRGREIEKEFNRLRHDLRSIQLLWTIRPSTTVMTTAPATGRVSKGEFFDFDLKEAASITQGRSRSKITRSAAPPILSCPSGKPRIVAGAKVSRSSRS